MSMAAEVHPGRQVCFGVDIGGTKTAVGVITADGTRLGWSVFPTRSRDPFAVFLEHLVGTIEALGAQLPADCRVGGVGVAAPAADAQAGRLDSPANLSWGSVAVSAPLEDRLSLPVALANDSHAAAWGGHLYGSARDLESFVLLTLGTGLGTGIMVDGNPLRGSHGLAGEAGHVTVTPGGRRCGCGRRRDHRPGGP